MDSTTADRMVRVLCLSAVLVLIALGSGTVSALTWHNETVDVESSEDALGNAGLGEYISLAMDNSDNPHLVYYLTEGLKYAWQDSAGWHFEMVEWGQGIGRHPSLRLDASGNPRISYSSGDGLFLKYAWRDSAGWHNETVESGQAVRSVWCGSSSLRQDAAGNPRIGYNAGGVLKYAWRDSTGWRNETVSAHSGTGVPSLALDSAGNPRMTFYQPGGDYYEYAKYAWNDGAGWQTETAWIGLYDWPVLEVDSTNKPHISLNGKDYAWRNSTGWHVETVCEDRSGYSSSLALDTLGNPRIISYDHSANNLQFAWRDGAGWHTETVDTGDFSLFPSLALDGSGNPCISYFDTTNGHIKYARVNITSPVVALPGVSPPTDTNDDGLYDDVNGNGRPDFADVVLYFNQMSWIAANEPITAFDYNGNGRIDFADVVWLFNHL